MRYFVELAYNGTHYCGWQRQPNQMTIQEKVEATFSMILRQPITVTGCGRTDTGVHAKQYFLHIEVEGEFPKAFLSRLNKVLPKDISIFRVFPVAAEAHARFDAYHRAYEYHLTFVKNPFQQETCFLFPYPKRPDFELMQAAANLLLGYDEFFPFCKTNTDVKTMICEMKRAEWVMDEDGNGMVFHIAANRFLRGMVRLIVGMTLNVGMGKITLEEVKTALETQTRLQKSWSVPPQGLFLKDIKYEFM